MIHLNGERSFTYWQLLTLQLRDGLIAHGNQDCSSTISKIRTRVRSATEMADA